MCISVCVCVKFLLMALPCTVRQLEDNFVAFVVVAVIVGHLLFFEKKEHD